MADYAVRQAEAILLRRSGYIEKLAAAFCLETALDATETVLVEQTKDGVTRWWFERRSGN